MLIKLSNFGENLISRPAGREAFLQAEAYLFPRDEKIDKLTFDFEGVNVLAPSWADEFITVAEKKFGVPVEFLHTENPSVQATLEMWYKLD